MNSSNSPLPSYTPPHSATFNKVLQQLVQLHSEKNDKKEAFQAVLNELVSHEKKQVELETKYIMQEKMMHQQEEAKEEMRTQQEEAKEEMRTQQQHLQQVQQKAQERQDRMMVRQDELVIKLLEQQEKMNSTIEFQRSQIDGLLEQSRISRGRLSDNNNNNNNNNNNISDTNRVSDINEIAPFNNNNNTAKKIDDVNEIYNNNVTTNNDNYDNSDNDNENDKDEGETRVKFDMIIYDNHDNENLEDLKYKTENKKTAPSDYDDDEEEDRPKTLVTTTRLAIEEVELIALEMYCFRTNIVAVNGTNIKIVMARYPLFFNPIIERNPHFDVMMANMLVLRFGVQVKEVDWTKELKSWDQEDNRRVGRAMAPFIRYVQTGEAAVAALRGHYPQLESLFGDVVGFEEFMNTIATSLLRDNKWGMVMRVSIGAALSMVDAVTDLYVITTYYHSPGLVGQANALLIMMSLSMLGQLLLVMAQYQKKSLAVKIRETLITLCFLRPAVDAFRVSTNHQDDETTVDPLLEMVSGVAFC